MTNEQHERGLTHLEWPSPSHTDQCHAANRAVLASEMAAEAVRSSELNPQTSPGTIFISTFTSSGPILGLACYLLTRNSLLIARGPLFNTMRESMSTTALAQIGFQMLAELVPDDAGHFVLPARPSSSCKRVWRNLLSWIWPLCSVEHQRPFFRRKYSSAQSVMYCFAKSLTHY